MAASDDERARREQHLQQTVDELEVLRVNLGGAVQATRDLTHQRFDPTPAGIVEAWVAYVDQLAASATVPPPGIAERLLVMFDLWDEWITDHPRVPPGLDGFVLVFASLRTHLLDVYGVCQEKGAAGSGICRRLAVMRSPDGRPVCDRHAIRQ